MEIKNEIKAKVFAQYLGQMTYITYNKPNGVKRDKRDKLVSCSNNGLIMVYDDEYLEEESRPECKLILRHLSAITDEEKTAARELVGNEAWHHIERQIDGDRGRYLPINPTEWLILFQYLCSIGIDIPQYLLGGKTLYEAGLAVYSE